MDDKQKMLLAVAGIGAYYLYTKSGTPTYYDMQGRPISTIICGMSATFDVRGYKRVWLNVVHDGLVVFDGPYDLPMPAYVFSCTSDIGVYNVSAYTVNANDTKGTLIGSTVFTVHAQV